MRGRDLAALVKQMGPQWMAWRGLYELQLRTGLLKRQFPPVSPDILLAHRMGVSVEYLGHHLVRKWGESKSRFPGAIGEDLMGAVEFVSEPEKACEMATESSQGRFRYFSRWWSDLGDPTDWLLNPMTDVRYTDDRHWTTVPDLSPVLGDIKYVWEASRSAHVYQYVRAYAVTGDDKYPEAFWRQLESWLEANPSEMGPNWRCAQEVAIRSLAWLFGLYAFRECAATTPRRVGRLLASLWYQVQHIERLHWYSTKCVRNNHAVTEAVALFTIGTILDFFPDSERWKTKGLRSFLHEIEWQIYDDGSYVQHSMNYSRVVVQLATWMLAVGKANGVDFPNRVRSKLGALVDLLWSVQDPKSGRVPNYGSNDGALLFPLSACDYLDYRPALNALNVALKGERLYGRGPWDEEAMWLCGRASLECQPTTVQRGSREFPQGGYYILRGDRTFGMVRCATYRHRPFQADMLHLDVWYDGCNVLLDPGTLSYNQPPRWLEYFVGTAAHNTCSVDGRNQMVKGDRFLWLDWPKGRKLAYRSVDGTQWFVGEHDGFKPVIHRRQVLLVAGLWVVLDDIFGDILPHRHTLHWLLPDIPLESDSTGALVYLPQNESPLVLSVSASHSGVMTWARGDESGVRGWHSLYYGEKLPAWSLRFEVDSTGPVSFATVLGPREDLGDFLVGDGSLGLKGPADVIKVLKDRGIDLESVRE